MSLAEGWGHPPRQQKIHFYRGDWSLCRRSHYTGPLFAASGSSPNLCAVCTKARAGEIAREIRATRIRE